MNVLTQPATPVSVRQAAAPMLRVIIRATVLPALLLAALYLYWGRGPVIATVPLFIPLMQGAMGLMALCVAFIAYCRCQVLRDPVSYWVGSAFITFFTSIIFYILAWPGLSSHGQGIIAHLTGTAAWIITTAQGLSGGLLLLAALARWPLPQAFAGRRWRWSVAAWVGGICVLNLLFVVFEARLPTMVSPSGTFSPLLLLAEVGLLFVFAIGSVLSTQRYRQSGDTLLAYVALTQIAWMFAQLLLLIGGKRYDLWWYLGRLFVTGGYLALLFGMLSEYVRLYHGERERSRALELSISERQQAEEALRASEARAQQYAAEMEAVFAAQADALIVYDCDMVAIRANAAARQLMGFEPHRQATIAKHGRSTYAGRTSYQRYRAGAARGDRHG